MLCYKVVVPIYTEIVHFIEVTRVQDMSLIRDDENFVSRDQGKHSHSSSVMLLTDTTKVEPSVFSVSVTIDTIIVAVGITRDVSADPVTTPDLCA